MQHGLGNGLRQALSGSWLTSHHQLCRGSGEQRRGNVDRGKSSLKTCPAQLVSKSLKKELRRTWEFLQRTLIFFFSYLKQISANVKYLISPLKQSGFITQFCTFLQVSICLTSHIPRARVSMGCSVPWSLLSLYPGRSLFPLSRLVLARVLVLVRSIVLASLGPRSPSCSSSGQSSSSWPPPGWEFCLSAVISSQASQYLKHKVLYSSLEMEIVRSFFHKSPSP